MGAYTLTLALTGPSVEWLKGSTSTGAGGAYAGGVALTSSHMAHKMFVDRQLVTEGQYNPEKKAPAKLLNSNAVECEFVANVAAAKYPDVMLRVSNDGQTTSKGHIPLKYALCHAGEKAAAD